MNVSLASPCTGVCKLDEVTSWCLGCGRGGQEIAEWGRKAEAWRSAVWAQIPSRLSALGAGCQRLPWTTDEIRGRARASLEEGRGTWVMGVVGAVAEFAAAPGEPVHFREEGPDFVARTRNGALRMRLDDDLRALSFDLGESQGTSPFLLAVNRRRGQGCTHAATLEDLGEDRDALIEDGAVRLFDLGLGRREARFCVRVGAGKAHDALIAAAGLPFAEALPKIAGALLAESPTRVVLTALGRVEVEGAIPPPTARSPAGPHTHLLPDHLATGRALPVGMELPVAYLPGALFYPPA
ncbi:MAG: DUF1289 domain-containing protein [Pseudomonadota bacterium]